MCIGGVNDNIAEYGFRDAPMALIVACAIYFPVVNRIIEEMFWRVFMHREVQIDHQHTQSSDIEQLSILETEEQIPHLGTAECHDESITIGMRIVFAMLFASYHTIVIGVFLGGIKYAIVSFFLIAILGMILEDILIRGNPTQGFNRALFLHIGIDIGVVVSLGDSIGWYNLV